MLGARACDLAALKVLDWVFLQGDFADPGYGARRESTLIVSTDCTAPMDVCFCTYLGGRPHAEEGYDLNLSPVDGGYVVDAGSDAGQSMLGEHGAELSEATDDRLRQRAERRQAATDRVARGVEKFGVGPLDDMGGRVLDSGESALWEELAEKCVECGACNFVCPTCHCFLLLDLQNRHGFRRFQNWDACLYPAFAREASGVNPRARRGQRLRGRMEKKWDFIPADSGLWGCVGCGRCIQACAGGIDIRETLRDLAHA